MQRAEWWLQCFVYWTVATAPDGKLSASAGVCVDERMVFGGAYAVNRFQRFSRMMGAYVQHKQDAFDACHPLPPCARRWQARRRSAAIAMGEQRDYDKPRHLQVYIDDWLGAALNDHVGEVPSLQHISVDPRATEAVGGTPSALGSRVRAMAQIAIDTLAEVKLEAAPSKTLCGDPIVGLGLRSSRVDRRLDIPAGKRAAMLEDMQLANTHLTASPPYAEVGRAKRIVGRLSNLSQVIPEVTAFMRGGHVITGSALKLRRPDASRMMLRAHSNAATGWGEMLTEAAQMVSRNEGVDLAPSLTFASMDTPGTAVSTTDASGTDGVGGYVFSADHPRVVWIVSEWWPPDVRAALACSAAGQGAGSVALSTAAAELFGSWAVPAAAATAGATMQRVIAIGDCQSAADALNATCGRRGQMNAIARHARAVSDEWLAVAVPRERNSDADLLTHPDRAAEVIQRARDAGYHVVMPRIADVAWSQLRAAMQLGTGAISHSPDDEATAGVGGAGHIAHAHAHIE